MPLKEAEEGCAAVHNQSQQLLLLLSHVLKDLGLLLQ